MRSSQFTKAIVVVFLEVVKSFHVTSPKYPGYRFAILGAPDGRAFLKRPSQHTDLALPILKIAE
jgi:hypothetical protein